MTKEYKIKSLSKILLISTIVILLLGGTLIYYYSITVTKSTKTITATETKTITTTIFLDTDGDGIPNYKEKEYGTDPNKPNFLLAYALKKLPENEALKFKNVENFNESSKVLVDYFSSLPENIRNSKEVNDLLNQILSDNIINELEKNLFYDKFVLPSLPLIFNLEWFPTREKLDKIYDINVTFVAKDDNTPIAYAELHFVPVEYHYMIEKYGMRQEDYSKVFPPDNERIYVLTPIDGKFDSLEEKFSVSINDIVGGRKYKIVVLIRDLAGNERKAEIKTPYIRQFENIAKTDNITVVVPYYLWYRKDLSNWKDGHKYMPLLGEYRSDDSIVMSKHIDWATGHGVDVLLVSWTGYEQGDLKYFDDNLKLFLKNPLSKDIKFTILYESVGRLKDSHSGWNLSDPENIEILDRDFSYLSKNYFGHPSYFRVDGKPLVYFYEGKGVFGDVSQIKKLREKYSIFLISDHGHPLANPWDIFPSGHPQAIVWKEAAKMFNEITSWLGGYSPDGNYLGGSYENQIKIGFSKWESWAIDNGKKFIPFITPEFDSRHVKWGNPNAIPLERSHQLFKERLIIGLNHTKTSKIIMIGTWKDFFESTTLEPSREYGFEYLNLLKEILKDFSQQVSRLLSMLKFYSRKVNEL
jgi:hypothetical protein